MIEIKTWDYSGKPSLSEVEEIVASAVDDFPRLSHSIAKLCVFIFTNEQIKKGWDLEIIRSISHIVHKPPKGWDMMRCIWNEDLGVIEVRIDRFMRSSEAHRKFITRHELSHISQRLGSGIHYSSFLDPFPIDPSVKDAVNTECQRILTIWTEHKVNSLVVRHYPELTLEYLNENVAGYSPAKDQEILSKFDKSDERFLVALRLIVLYENWLSILEKAPSLLKDKMWNSLKRQYSEHIRLLKREASQIHLGLKDVDVWFPEQCWEDHYLLRRRVLELFLHP